LLLLLNVANELMVYLFDDEQFKLFYNDA
jgi:hypothetical protein